MQSRPLVSLPTLPHLPAPRQEAEVVSHFSCSCQPWAAPAEKASRCSHTSLSRKSHRLFAPNGCSRRACPTCRRRQVADVYPRSADSKDVRGVDTAGTYRNMPGVRFCSPSLVCKQCIVLSEVSNWTSAESGTSTETVAPGWQKSAASERVRCQVA